MISVNVNTLSFLSKKSILKKTIRNFLQKIIDNEDDRNIITTNLVVIVVISIFLILR